ncbi:MAG: hypothetical protein ABR552_08820 [Actinomycetota bacterium]
MGKVAAHRTGARALVAVVLAAGLLSISAGTAVARPPTGGGSSGSAACSVTPNPVGVNQTWTLTGTGLAAGQVVNVLISDAYGTSGFNLQANSSGVVTVSWGSAYAGTHNVKINSTGSKKISTLATCAFQVV